MVVHLRSYNSYGNWEKKNSINEKQLIVVRMQIKNIRSEHQRGQNLGSVVYCQSFFIIEPKTYICLTKNVPNSLLWLTDNLHYRNMPMPLDLDKPFECTQLGEKKDSTKNDIVGFYPIREEFHKVLPDRILTGKITFFDHGIVFEDMRLGAFVMPYSSLEKIIFHGNTNSKNDWIEFVLNEEGRNLVPCGYIAESSFYLLVKHEFCNSTLLRLQKLREELELEQIRERNKRLREKGLDPLGSQNARQVAPQVQVEDEELKFDEDATEDQSTAAETATAAAQSEAASDI